MQHEITEAGSLLNESGDLREPGFSRRMLLSYDRNAVKAGRLRIKEWDYYIVTDGRYAVALTVDDNSYMGLTSASFLDLTAPAERTRSYMSFMPCGKTGFPSSSAEGDVEYSDKNCKFSFKKTPEERRLFCELPDFDGGSPLLADFRLSEEPEESMVIATPFSKRGHFYYNQKINCMRAEGTVIYRGREYYFDPAVSMGTLDWGRGVWTYSNTWYWGSGSWRIDGVPFGFNIGYGFGDTSAATENMLFYDGKAHKLSQVSFNIPKNADGSEDYMSPWTFTSDDGRFEMDFSPVLDRKSLTSALVILSDQHQVFGRFRGRAVLDDGRVIEVTDMPGFAEKVRNKW